MRTSTGRRPKDLGLGGVQLEPIGTHPVGNVIETISDDRPSAAPVMQTVGRTHRSGCRLHRYVGKDHDLRLIESSALKS